MPGEYLAELAAALATLLDGGSRAAYDESLEEALAAAESRESETPAADGTGGGLESPGGLTWSARALAALSSALTAVAEGGRSALTSAGGGRRAVAQLRRPDRIKKPAAPLPDERLLRDVTAVAAKTSRAAPHNPLRGRLVVRSPDGREETVDLGEQPVTLGSERECDVRLDTEKGPLAPAHAQIWFNGERFLIRSLDPLCPTLVCGQRVNWAGLDNGDEIEIGPHRLRFEVVEQWDTPPEFLTIDREAANVEEIPERHD
jgi:hypothetical protein